MGLICQIFSWVDIHRLHFAEHCTGLVIVKSTIATILLLTCMAEEIGCSNNKMTLMTTLLGGNIPPRVELASKNQMSYE